MIFFHLTLEKVLSKTLHCFSLKQFISRPTAGVKLVIFFLPIPYSLSTGICSFL